MANAMKLVLASGSPRRLALLEQAGVVPDLLSPAEMDETPHKAEAARSLAKRLAREKAEIAVASMERIGEREGALRTRRGYCRCGRSPDPAQVRAARRGVRLPAVALRPRAPGLYGRLAHHAEGDRPATPGGNAGADEEALVRRVRQLPRFGRMARPRRADYAIQGIAGAFVIKLVGSYTNVVGLPLYETMQLLQGEGFPVHFNWINAR